MVSAFSWEMKGPTTGAALPAAIPAVTVILVSSVPMPPGASGSDVSSSRRSW